MKEQQFEQLLMRLDRWLERDLDVQVPDWSAPAYRCRRVGQTHQLVPVHRLSDMCLEDLLGIDRQKATLERNTRQFIAGQPSNNALLWGARGTGKSSLIKALLNRYHADGLRLLELDSQALTDLPDMVAPLAGRPERFLLYVDDLSFSEGDPGYRALKAALDGSVSVAPENVLIYASSNRRHLMPETHADNQSSRMIDGELHHGEAVEEKISLSERFGVWLAFHPFSQDQYLAVTAHWLQRLADRSLDDEARAAALAWALRRGNRSGRVAMQFARDWAGSRALEAR